MNIARLRPTIAGFSISRFSSVADVHNIFDMDQIGAERKMIISAFGDRAFKVNDKLIRQSILLLPRSLYLWNAKTFADITIDSLALFPLVYPTIEILFIGKEEFYCCIILSVTLF